MSRFPAVALATTTLLVLILHGAAAENTEKHSLAKLAPKEFLHELRRPLRQDAWGENDGRIMHSSAKGRVKGDIRIRMSFSPDAMHAQIVLNGVNVYAFEQTHRAGDIPKTELNLPEHETAPGLFSFGVKPEDLTFAFIYWKFIKELPPENFHRRPCRVMDLADPNDNGFVRVWFHAEYGFPMLAKWYRQKEKKPWRTLELKGAKKHDDDLWFVKEMRLNGDGWKTKVRFDHVEINPLGEKGKPQSRK